MDKRCIEATFEIVTPMFLGDGDQEARIIRPQSFKAELLFWWRALHYAGYVERAEGNNQTAALTEMHKDETLLFGGAKAQAAFLLRVEHSTFTPVPSGQTLAGSGPGCGYLGFGLMDQHRVLTRSCVPAEGKFEIELIFRPMFRNRVLVASLVRSLKLTGLVGALGSRKRRGFGSIAMMKMTISAGLKTFLAELDKAVEDLAAPSDKASYEKCLGVLISKPLCKRKDFLLSAFSADTDLCVWASPRNTAMEALEAIGSEFQKYRGWGFGDPPKVAGVPSRKNFEADHDWYRKVNLYAGKDWDRRTNKNIPERAIFGLPHNYGKDLGIAAIGEKPSRRASPLFFHIAKIGSNYLPVATYFDTQFLPKNEISLNSRSALAYVPNAAVIHDFLDGKSRSAPPKAQITPALFTKVLP